MTTYSLDLAGHVRNVGQSFDVRTNTGAFVGLVSERFNSGICKVYFNSNATRGSARKFASVQEAVEFIHNRRVSKGRA